MDQSLKNKRALVTKGSRGIEAAIVKRLASEGADVALTYSSSPDRASDVVKAAQALGVRSLATQADSADATVPNATLLCKAPEGDLLALGVLARVGRQEGPGPLRSMPGASSGHPRSRLARSERLVVDTPLLSADHA
jgi:NAD(P)-dependent dehydrogenase (short-subunit alcohol dehydrogenase family)